MNVGSLFCGIGGLDLGLERAGMTVRWQSEIDPYASRVLTKHWPDVPNLGDITTIDWSTVEPVDLICGGYPCQPFSLAGVRRGEVDPRHLWPAMRDAIRLLRPRFVLLENVAAHLGLGFDRVLADLAALGFNAEWSTVSACSVGAPHTRRRLFAVAYSSGDRWATRWDDRRGPSSPPSGQSQGTTTQRGSWWADEPALDRVAYGVPDRVHRVRALGNAVVPPSSRMDRTTHHGGSSVTVQLAPIRPDDLQAGDTLINADGYRVTLHERCHVANGWHVENDTLLIADVDIDRTGPDRQWWLDEAAPRETA